VTFFDIIQKLGDDNFLFISGWVEFLYYSMFVFVFQECFEKKNSNFLLFSLLQINIFDVFVFFLILFLNILRLGLAAQPDSRRIY